MKELVILVAAVVAGLLTFVVMLKRFGSDCIP